ncbi:MAG: hypothetical protein N2512_09210 [Armatimonadetes bacterium]|nr:hypothetical protein [Armatimonadota bacterium]
MTASGMCFVLLMSAAATASSADAPPLTFRTVGFYGIHLPVGDFAFLKFDYGGPEDDKRIPGYNALLEEVAQAGQKAIVGLYTFDRVTHKRPVEEYVRNTEALVGGLRQDLVYAFCPSEENVTWNNGLEILNALYDAVKRKSDRPCYQWLTMPDPPHGKLKADGWILDAYGFTYDSFRRHLARFVVTGKPVIVCVNATSPKVPWAAEGILVGDPGSPAEDQMRVCREFNVPVFFYAVGKEFGNVHEWFHDDEELTARSRRWALQWINRAHAEPPGILPLRSADYLDGRPMEVCGGADNVFRARFLFDDTDFLDFAGVEGLLSLRWDGFAERLFVEGAGTPRRAFIFWHLAAPFEMENLRAEVKGTFAGEGTQVAVGLCPTLVHWHGQVVNAAPEEKEFAATAAIPQDWHGRHAWLMVELRAGPGGQVALEAVEVTGRTQPPAEKIIRLAPGPQPAVLYRDDFTTPKLMHFAEIDRPRELHWRPGQWYTTGADGDVNRVRLRLHFVSDKPLADGEVRLGATAWTRDHASRVVAGLSANGNDILVSRDSSKLPQEEQWARFNGVIVLPLAESPKLVGGREFWLILDLISESGVKAGPSAMLNFLEVVGRSGEN